MSTQELSLQQRINNALTPAEKEVVLAWARLARKTKFSPDMDEHIDVRDKLYEVLRFPLDLDNANEPCNAMLDLLGAVYFYI